MSESVRMELIGALRNKLTQLGKMQRHLAFSQTRAAEFLPLTDMGLVDDGKLELLAALKGRFAELQDHIASAMKLIARLEEQDITVFTHVVNFMEKIGVIEDFHRWHGMRGLRNDAAHEYDCDPVAQANFYNKLFAAIPELFRTLAALEQFCRLTYAEEK